MATCDVLVIAANNGQNRQLAECFAAAAPGQSGGTPPGLAALQTPLASAPRWVICAPGYNFAIPPLLTSAIAWLSVQGDDFLALFNGRPLAIATHRRLHRIPLGQGLSKRLVTSAIGRSALPQP